ncbi:MAG: tripartite tricarboxylate transporter TctB family protein, partial [Rhodobacteraceae bacterium]|nr:tripartite tricarboxylate transporter TctB family protein [Paracoccaceae bacterium]
GGGRGPPRPPPPARQPEPRNDLDMLARLLPGILTVATGVALLAFFIPMGVEVPRFVAPNSLKPGDFPTYLAWVVLSCGVLLVVAGLRDPDTAAVSPGRISPARTAGFLGGFIGLVALIEHVGIELAAFGFAVLLFLFASHMRPVAGAVLAVGLAVAIHLVFIRLAGVPLPSTPKILF